MPHASSIWGWHLLICPTITWGWHLLICPILKLSLLLPSIGLPPSLLRGLATKPHLGREVLNKPMGE